MNITDPIRRRARMTPTAVAVIRADNSVVTYGAFDRMIDTAAARIDGMGLAAGQICGLAISGPDEFVPLVLALALARSGIASADPALPSAHLAACLIPAGAATRDDVRTTAFDPGWVNASREIAARPINQDAAAICRVFASSGTTGTPKFAAISHDLIARRVVSNDLSMPPVQPVHICAVSFGTTAGFCDVLRTLWGGGTLVLTNPGDAVAAIGRHQVGSIQIAVGSLARLVETLPDAAEPLPSPRYLVTGGSSISPLLLDVARRKLCGDLVSYFGATETGGVASAPFAALRGIDGAVGYVHAGVEVQAVDPDGTPLPPGTEGILRIRGGNNVAGYFAEATPSPDVFKDGWFHSGDIGAVTADGIMIVNGRVAEFINAGGVKVNPKLIEDALLALPDVSDAAAFGVPDSLGVTQIWAAIVASVPIPTSVLRRACLDKLGGSVPKFILQVPRLPRNPNGKVMRDELARFAATQRG